MKVFIRIAHAALLLSCGCLWQGCKTVNQAVPTPTYIHIDSFHVRKNDTLQPYNLAGNPPVQETGEYVSTTHQMNEAWVYYNNNPIGIFDLPATFPVIASGTGVLTVMPGIIADGENNDVINYTFCSAGTYTFTAQPGQTINYTPTTEYYSADNVGIICNFSDNASYLQGNPVSIMATNTDSLVLQAGGSVGILSLSAPNADSAIDSSTFTFAIPTGMAYIEFDYNSTVPFYVGLQANLSNFISSTPVYLTGVYPNSGWQKFYLEVDGFTATAQASSYKFYLKANLQPGQTSGRLLITNIQVVTGGN